VQIFAAPGVGVCRIAAGGPILENDDYGSAVRQTIDRVAQQLSDRYGEGDKTDSCDSDRSTCRAGYWTMHLSQGSRSYGYEWTSPRNDHGISRIELFASATDRYDPYPVLRYTFDNFGRCEATLNQQAGQAL
jgi:hypothetical protein